LAQPVNALTEDFRTFNTRFVVKKKKIVLTLARVVADTTMTIEKMERARLEYDAYKLWLKVGAFA
jgi:hypothetical protein